MDLLMELITDHITINPYYHKGFINVLLKHCDGCSTAACGQRYVKRTTINLFSERFGKVARMWIQPMAWRLLISIIITYFTMQTHRRASVRNMIEMEMCTSWNLMENLGLKWIYRIRKRKSFYHCLTFFLIHREKNKKHLFVFKSILACGTNLLLLAIQQKPPKIDSSLVPLFRMHARQSFHTFLYLWSKSTAAPDWLQSVTEGSSCSKGAKNKEMSPNIHKVNPGGAEVDTACA